MKGPLHGGANEEVMHMMSKIKKPENALKWINNALDNKDVVMGFGIGSIKAETLECLQ